MRNGFYICVSHENHYHFTNLTIPKHLRFRFLDRSLFSDITAILWLLHRYMQTASRKKKKIGVVKMNSNKHHEIQNIARIIQSLESSNPMVECEFFQIFSGIWCYAKTNLFLFVCNNAIRNRKIFMFIGRAQKKKKKESMPFAMLHKPIFCYLFFSLDNLAHRIHKT